MLLLWQSNDKLEKLNKLKLNIYKSANKTEFGNNCIFRLSRNISKGNVMDGQVKLPFNKGSHAVSVYCLVIRKIG